VGFNCCASDGVIRVLITVIGEQGLAASASAGKYLIPTYHTTYPHSHPLSPQFASNKAVASPFLHTLRAHENHKSASREVGTRLCYPVTNFLPTDR
jgi:hypothetical protein